MNMKIVRLSSLLFAFVLGASAFCFDYSALAGNPGSQNANSSSTEMQNSNTGTTTRRRSRRGRRAAASTSETTTAAAEGTESTAGPTEQTDLSGTYNGTFKCDSAGVNGETTLTITGNQYTLTDGKAGRIVAATTRGYTAVAMQFGEWVAGTGMKPGVSPIVVSMRAKKSGDRLTLTTVPGVTNACSFTPARK